MNDQSNPFLGEKVRCKTCTHRVAYTTNTNGVCGRHREGRAHLGRAMEWAQAHEEAGARCVGEACDREAVTRGMCQMHYMRFRRTGNIDGYVIPACTEPGCDRDAKARGLCTMHYERYRRYGDPGAVHDTKGRKVKVGR